ncbi:hypothetical protein C8034_v004999 [Colletotrichum sidae]|uniref:F-box domain-containing protein n=1 Tax=Colletotrichum sidae TaxID=1347389 RepID=A0A4R8T7I4_9PEZI|nr:hypothetical protein C8034_v004999 [Colletotrichum sidae]
MPTWRYVAILKEADLHASNYNRWACYGEPCLKLLPKDAFGIAMTKSKDTRKGEWLSRYGTRRCWACAIAERMYSHMVPVKKEGKIYRLCHDCGNMQSKSRRGCKNVKNTGGSDQQVLMAASNLERLPAKVLGRVVEELGLLDCMHLQQVCLFMREAVQTHWVPLHRRFAFVRRWEPGINLQQPDQSLVAGTALLPCYSCFTVKPEGKFSRKQLELSQQHPITFWKRRCSRCVQTMYQDDGHKGANLCRPASLSGGIRLSRGEPSEALDEFKRRSICGTCQNKKYMEESCKGCLEHWTL